jgi:hypothetical protein
LCNQPDPQQLADADHIFERETLQRTPKDTWSRDGATRSDYYYIIAVVLLFQKEKVAQ